MKNNLIQLRKSKKMCQNILALRLGVSRQIMIFLEKKIPPPSITLAFKIARYCCVTIEELFIYEEEEDA